MKLIVLFCCVYLGIFERIVLGKPAKNNYINDDKNIPYIDDSEESTEDPEYVKVGEDATQTEDNEFEVTPLPIMECECAVFDTMFPNTNDLPIFIQVPSSVDCDHNGDEDCIALCSVLAKAAENHGPELICSISDYETLRASIHSRVNCSSSIKWTYIGLTTHEYICCQQHRVTNCTEDNESDYLTTTEQQ